MRWRMIDRITGFEQWQSCSGVKAVSLEEYALHEPLGRKGFLPESLALETCVELVRLMILKSSDFTIASRLIEIEGLTFHRPIKAGQVMDISTEIISRESDGLRSLCRALCDGTEVISGEIGVQFFDLEGSMDRKLTEELWQELNAHS